MSSRERTSPGRPKCCDQSVVLLVTATAPHPLLLPDLHDHGQKVMKPFGFRHTGLLVLFHQESCGPWVEPSWTGPGDSEPSWLFQYHSGSTLLTLVGSLSQLVTLSPVRKQTGAGTQLASFFLFSPGSQPMGQSQALEHVSSCLTSMPSCLSLN